MLKAAGPAPAPQRSRGEAWSDPGCLSSTGEQKALLISIVLAHARLLATDRTPRLLLLDEIPPTS